MVWTPRTWPSIRRNRLCGWSLVAVKPRIDAVPDVMTPLYVYPLGVCYGSGDRLPPRGTRTEESRCARVSPAAVTRSPPSDRLGGPGPGRGIRVASEFDIRPGGIFRRSA